MTTNKACTAATEAGGLWDCECEGCAALRRRADAQDDIVDSLKANEEQWDTTGVEVCGDCGHDVDDHHHRDASGDAACPTTR